MCGFCHTYCSDLRYEMTVNLKTGVCKINARHYHHEGDDDHNNDVDDGPG